MKGLSVCSLTDNFCRLALGQCFTDSVIRSIGTRTIHSFENYSNIPTSALSILPVIPWAEKHRESSCSIRRPTNNWKYTRMKSNPMAAHFYLSHSGNQSCREFHEKFLRDVTTHLFSLGNNHTAMTNLLNNPLEEWPLKCDGLCKNYPVQGKWCNTTASLTSPNNPGRQQLGQVGFEG